MTQKHNAELPTYSFLTVNSVIALCKIPYIMTTTILSNCGYLISPHSFLELFFSPTLVSSDTAKNQDGLFS